MMPRPGNEKAQPTTRRHPALALLEYSSVAAGIHAADALLKRAPIALLKLGTVQPGHYLILLGGSVASVEEAFGVGVAMEPESILDSVILPEVHAQVFDASLGARRALADEALGVLETHGTAALLRAADAAVKGAHVDIAEIRLADDLGGHAFVLFDGSLADVTAALEIGAGRLDSGRILRQSVLPRLDENLRRLLEGGTRFGPCAPLTPDGAELLEEVGDAAG